MYADFGWAGKIPGERWAPITVWVQGGERAFGGEIVAEFVQDATQSARIRTPFAATPGERTAVPIVAALPVSCGEVRLRMYNERGRELADVTYARMPDTDQARLPDVLDPTAGVFVSAGGTSLAEAVSYWASRQPEGGRDPRRDIFNATMLDEAPTEDALAAAWALAMPATVDPALLPISWMAYDGVTVLAVDGPAAAKADPRAVDAVRRWVEAGGRLAILATDPGPQWRSWLPDGEAGELVVAAAPERVPLPGECLEAINTEALSDLRQDRLDTESNPEVERPRPPVVAPASSAPCRLLTLTAGGEAEGWRVRWRTDRGAAMAEGPVGLGWVVVLGLDPRTAPSVLSARTSGAVWRDALGVAARDWVEAAAVPGTGIYGHASSEPEQAIGAALEGLAGGASPGGGIFLAIAACMLGLAALVGPVDYFVLKRLGQSQRSWISALSWIGLASLGAYAAPRMVRDAPTQVARLTAIDRLVPRAGSTAEAPPTAWQAGVTGVFSGESRRLRFTSPDESAWWRGVAAFSMFGSNFVTASVTTQQAAAGGAEGSGRGNPLEAIGLSLWTFRAFIDQSRVACGVSAAVDRDGEGWRVRVTGLPEGASVMRTLLRIGEDRFTSVVPLAPEDGSCDWVVGDAPSEDGVLNAWYRAGWSEGAYGTVGPRSFERPGLAASLPGAIDRTVSIDERVATGGYAAVHLHVTDWPTDAPVDGSARSTRLAVLRLVVPLDEADRVPATPARPLERFASQGGRARLPIVRPSSTPPPPPPPPSGPMGPESPEGQTPPADPPEEPRS